MNIYAALMLVGLALISFGILIERASDNSGVMFWLPGSILEVALISYAMV